MLAQNLVEYGALGSAMAGVQQSMVSAARWLGTLSPTGWAVAGGIVLLALLMRRRASRF
jgi:hypothetical protein